MLTLNQKFNQNDYIKMNTKLRENAKNDFGKDFFKLIMI